MFKNTKATTKPESSINLNSKQPLQKSSPSTSKTAYATSDSSTPNSSRDSTPNRTTRSMAKKGGNSTANETEVSQVAAIKEVALPPALSYITASNSIKSQGSQSTSTDGESTDASPHPASPASMQKSSAPVKPLRSQPKQRREDYESQFLSVTNDASEPSTDIGQPALNFNIDVPLPSAAPSPDNAVTEVALPPQLGKRPVKTTPKAAEWAEQQQLQREKTANKTSILKTIKPTISIKL